MIRGVMILCVLNTQDILRFLEIRLSFFDNQNFLNGPKIALWVTLRSFSFVVGFWPSRLQLASPTLITHEELKASKRRRLYFLGVCLVWESDNKNKKKRKQRQIGRVNKKQGSPPLLASKILLFFF